jgi:hypothetical protein
VIGAHRLGGPKLTTESGKRSAMQLVRRVLISGLFCDMSALTFILARAGWPKSHAVQ